MERIELIQNALNSTPADAGSHHGDVIMASKSRAGRDDSSLSTHTHGRSFPHFGSRDEVDVDDEAEANVEDEAKAAEAGEHDDHAHAKDHANTGAEEHGG